MIKRILMLFLFSLLFSAGVHAYEAPVDIKVNGEYIYTDTGVVIDNGVSLAPVRQLSTALGAEAVDWNSSDYVVGIDMGDDYISIDINNNKAYIENLSYNVDARIIGSRTYVPVRFISEFSGASVDWNDQYKNIEITIANYTPDSSVIDAAYNEDELVWMSRIIHAESMGEPMLGKIAVGNVILNRVGSNLFPNTIYGVIFDRTYAVQFEPVSNGSIYNNPNPDCIAAAKLAFRQDSVVGPSLYFYNPTKVGSSWISRTRPYHSTIANHAFYL